MNQTLLADAPQPLALRTAVRRPAEATPADADRATEAVWSHDQPVAVRLPTNERVRKVLHMLPGVVPFVLAAVPHPRPLPIYSLVAVTVITAALTLLYVAMRRRVERPNETDFWLTTLSYPAAVLASLYAFRDAPEIACVVVVTLALGDGSACLGGRLFGRTRLPWNRAKSWAGTLAFVLVAGPVATLAYHFEAFHFGAGSAATWTLAAAVSFAAVAFAAVAESLPVRLSDNLRVGLTAAVVAALMQLEFGPPAA